MDLTATGAKSAKDKMDIKNREQGPKSNTKQGIGNREHGPKSNTKTGNSETTHDPKVATIFSYCCLNLLK